MNNPLKEVLVVLLPLSMILALNVAILINKDLIISVNRLRTRKQPFPSGDWIMDSGAFTELSNHGGYRDSVIEYAHEIRRWHRYKPNTLRACVSQDYMCEEFILRKTGMTVAEHQRLTIERYDQLIACNLPVYLMPVLQGYMPEEYCNHLTSYGKRLEPEAWVGVGSVCKRNSNPDSIIEILVRLKQVRPDLRLHGFGLKKTALTSPIVLSHLYSCDSMAWSFAARKEYRDANSVKEALTYFKQVQAIIRGEHQCQS